MARSVCPSLILAVLFAVTRFPGQVTAGEAWPPWGAVPPGAGTTAGPYSGSNLPSRPRSPKRPNPATRPISWPGSETVPLSAGRTPDSRPPQTRGPGDNANAGVPQEDDQLQASSRGPLPVRLTGTIEPAPFTISDHVSLSQPDSYAPRVADSVGASPTSNQPPERAGQQFQQLDTAQRKPSASAGAFAPSPTPSADSSPAFQGGYVRQPALPSTVARRAPDVAPNPQIRELTGATIIARVGKEVIVASEVMGVVNAILEENADKIPPEKLALAREQLIRQRLKPLIDQKLVVADFRRSIPEENYPLVIEKVGATFEEKEIKRLMRGSGARTRVELEEKLAAMGMSLERQKQTFVETTLAQQWLREQMKMDDEITHAEMLAYYNDHADEFAIVGRARWQHVMLRFDRHASKDAARRRLAELGNRIVSRVPFEDVTRQFSDGPTASSGGLRDWTTEGSLVSDELNQALTGLPVGSLSRILEGPRGYHIVRVLERQQAGWTPFIEAQVEIKKKIRQQRNRDRAEEYLAQLLKRIPTWTMFDESTSSPSLSGRNESLPPR